MRKRASMLLLLVAVVISICLMTVLPMNSRGSAASEPKAAVTQRESPKGDPIGTIDGARNPELIPDHMAYMAILRMLANRQTEEERHSIRTYVRQVMGLGNQDWCRGCRESFGPGDGDIDALLAAAEEFNVGVSALDEQAMSIKDANWPNPSPEIMARLTELDLKRDVLIKQIAISLPLRLSKGGMARVQQHIAGYVKRNIKLTPAPATPPGGHGWQREEGHH